MLIDRARLPVCVALGVAAINRAHYGVFATTAVTAPGYLAANRALTGIEQPAPRRYLERCSDGQQEIVCAHVVACWLGAAAATKHVS